MTVQRSIRMQNLRSLVTTVVGAAIVLLGFGVATAAQWEADWIGPAEVGEEGRKNSWYCCRTTLSVESAPEEFPTRIACDSKYWLWVNGEQVVLEGGLKRGPTPTGTYYDQIDLAPFLKKGDNTIAVLLWHFGKHGFSHNDSGKVGLLVDGTTDGLSLRTDATWRMRRHPAFEDANDPMPNYRLPEGNIRYDARKALPEWQTKANVDDWPTAVEQGRPPVAPWGELIERPIPQWKDYGVRQYVSVAESKTEDGRTMVSGKLPYNCHVHPIMSITAPAGHKIEIQTDLLSNGRDYFLRAEYITGEGVQDFELPGWLNGHEVRYILPEGVTINEISYRETGYDAQFAGSFRCDNERLNLLWEKARRTLYVTMRDTYMDCPERERAQWWGDAVNELGEAFYVFDATNGPRLARKGMYELAAFQRDDKTIYSPVPAGIPAGGTRDNLNDGSWSRELPRQMLASVGFYGFWNYYRYTGDAETIRDVYPAVRDYLSVWELDEAGLAVHRPGEWDWTDWGQNMDVAVLENAWLHLALRGAAEMADLLGETEDAARYRGRMKQIEAAFDKTFWQGEFYRSPTHEGLTDDRANALAVVAGIADPANYPAITEFLKTNTHASPYMEKYVLEALYLMGEPEAAVDRMLGRYASMIDCPETTLWENFARAGSDEPGSGTYNHAWSGGPLTMMHQYVAGIEPTEPGFKRFSVKPQLAPLGQVECVVPTQFGPITFSATRDDAGQIGIKLTVPKGTTADVKVGNFEKTFQEGTRSFVVASGTSSQ
jgi:alpha-L-rhamnosidase